MVIGHSSEGTEHRSTALQPRAPKPQSNVGDALEACKHRLPMVGPDGSRRFPTTRWGLVARAKAGTPDGRVALGTLIRPYWYPLYAFIRRSGYLPSDAEELTQGFLTFLIERDDIGRAASRLEAEAATWEAGRREPRFRRWLLNSLRNFLINHRKYIEAEKRGGKVKHLTIDYRDAERRYSDEPKTTETPEALYVRQWALTIVRQAHEALRSNWVYAGKEARFEVLELALVDGMSDADCARLAPGLSTTPAAVKADAFRLRREFRELLRGLISDTLGEPVPPDPPDPDPASASAPSASPARRLVDDELRVLLRSLR